MCLRRSADCQMSAIFSPSRDSFRFIRAPFLLMFLGTFLGSNRDL